MLGVLHFSSWRCLGAHACLHRWSWISYMDTRTARCMRAPVATWTTLHSLQHHAILRHSLCCSAVCPTRWSGPLRRDQCWWRVVECAGRSAGSWCLPTSAVLVSVPNVFLLVSEDAGSEDAVTIGSCVSSLETLRIAQASHRSGCGGMGGCPVPAPSTKNAARHVGEHIQGQNYAREAEKYVWDA